MNRLLDVAQAAIAERDLASAFETLQQAESIEESAPRLHLLYALAYYQKKELPEAEASARKALELDPKFSAAKNTLGKILLDQKRWAEAEPLLKSAASDLVYRESHLAKTNLGILYYKKNDFKNATLWLKKAIDEGAFSSCIARLHLGKIQLEQNSLTEAMRSFKVSIKSGCGTLPETHFAEGQTLLRQKKYDQARAKFVEIQRLFPDDEAFDQAAEFIRGIP